MVDTHYDLLSICYRCYLRNDYSDIEKFSKEIKQSGVKCIFANLYFMSKEEMIHELHPNYYNENVSVLEMFKISKSILIKYLQNIDFIYSIEGCDYINVSDLEDLYNEGLRSILIVWNNKNKYGSGNRSKSGLTKKGKEFLNKAIELGIGIDLSHTNKKTFFDIINYIKLKKKENKNIVCYASHSNARSLHDIERNLTDKQLECIKEINGYVGVISNNYFIDKKETSEEKSKEYLKHIIYISNIVGVNRIMLSTDDMRFASDIDEIYKYRPIYEYSNIKQEIESELSNYFNKKEINMIMYKNAHEIYKKLTN